jgi:hypothetical protein
MYNLGKLALGTFDGYDIAFERNLHSLGYCDRFSSNS